MWAVMLAILLALVLPPFINVNRYRGRVAGAISRAIGRDVTVSNIELKVLPRPGLVLYNFVAADDPSYGAEPMLRADTVTAYLRLTSLWRGRLEIGTLDLDSPSLNLVRRADGHWNIEELIGRASQTNPAPTSKTRPEARPRFPYVEASTGRINFKLGEVKKAFSFTNADFALWLESESQWGVRIDGRPVRTDVNISDTGTISLEGRFQRAASLRDTPLYFKLNYSDAPLGQLTKLIYARDRGWRGTVRASAVLTGTPSSAALTLDAQVTDFRRYDIATGEALRLRTHCTGTYSTIGDSLYDLRCESPIGTGIVRVRGDAQSWGAGGYDLDISGEHIPADRLVAFARHTKKDLPDDLTATGEVGATFTVRKSADNSPQWSGGGQATSLTLHSNVLKQDLELGEIAFAVPSSNSTPAAKSKRAPHHPAPPVTPAGVLQIVVQPFPVPLGAVSPATGSAELTQDRYSFRLAGGAELGRLLNVAQALGVGTPGVGLEGSTQFDLQLAGPWTGFAEPSPTGKLQINTATAELQGVSEPLQVDSATIELQNQMVSITSLSAGFTHGMQLTGSANFPVHCTSSENCVVQFDMKTQEASLERLNQLLNPAFSREPWYHLLAIGKQHNDALLKLRAQGRFSAQRLGLGDLAATNVNGSLELSSGKLRVHELRGDLLGGHEDGSWLADFTVSPPRFMGNGVVSKISMSQVASLMHDTWATGSVDAEYSVSMSGMAGSKLASSAGGSADFRWTNGALRHVTLEGHGAPMLFANFVGKLALQDGTFTVTNGKMQSGGNKYTVSGTANYDGSLKVKMDRSGGTSYVISGTLTKPTVQSITTPAAEASLR
jgi:AsmA family/AsmA-like C-terminal region